MLKAKFSKEELQVRDLTSSLKLFKIIISNLLETTEEVLTSYLEKMGMAWCVEIVTK
jgi:hypothetical protein